jgi:hypothetical protein
MPSAQPPRWRAAKPLERLSSFVPAPRRTAIKALLTSGETVQWIGVPDPVSAFRSQLVFWWIGVPWTAVALILFFSGFISEGWTPFVVMPGLALVAAPFLLAFYADGTVYALTNQRAIVVHDALGKKQIVSVPFEDMNERLEILPVRPGIGHLYFASGMSTKLSNVDHTGRLAFREVARPEAVAEALERARAQWRAGR